MSTTLTLGDMGYQTIPAGLTPAELIAYRAGFDRGDRAYLKATGGPAVNHGSGGAPAPGSAERRMLALTLAANGREYRAGRHDKAHKAGMSALRSYLKKAGQADRLAKIVDPWTGKRAGSAPRKHVCHNCGAVQVA